MSYTILVAQPADLERPGYFLRFINSIVALNDELCSHDEAAASTGRSRRERVSGVDRLALDEPILRQALESNPT
jgi:hypothetical protein